MAGLLEPGGFGQGLLSFFANLDPENRKALQDQERQAQDMAMKKQDFDLRTQLFQMQKQKAERDQMQEQGRNSYLDSLSNANGPARPLDPAQAMASGLGPQEIGMLQPKRPELMNVPAGGSVFDPVKQQPVYQAPVKPAQEDEFTQLLRNAGIDPQSALGRQKYVEMIMRKLAPPQGPAITLMSPVAGMIDGQPGMIQPSNRPGGAAMPLTVNGKVVQPMPASGGVPSEDERKAAGWFDQASNAYQNMLKAMQDSGGAAAKPNLARDIARRLPFVGEPLANATTPETRQRFEQAASSFSEATLRAATGAGVNKDEATQKVRELTPQWGDKPSTVAQKAASAQVYLQSLKTRAGRAPVQNLLGNPTANGWSVTVEK